MNEPEVHRSESRITLVLVAVLVLCAAYLFFGLAFEWAFAAIAALIGFPMALGALVAHGRDPTGQAPIAGCIIWPTVAILVLIAVGWIAFGEGAICIAMVMPIWLAAAIGGGLIQLLNARRSARLEKDPDKLLSVGWTALPLLILAAETAAPLHWTRESVTREIVIQASPQEVWPLLLSIPNIAPDEGRPNVSQDLLGIPRPSNAVLVRSNGKLVRKAQWGHDVRFEEHILAIEPHRAISWAFAFPDRSVQQSTDRHISPDGPILRIDRGRYDLKEIAPGVTRLRLVTHYRMKTRLAPYLRWWGDTLLGDIQDNVLAIVKDRAEKLANRKIWTPEARPKLTKLTVAIRRLFHLRQKTARQVRSGVPEPLDRHSREGGSPHFRL
jgi:hypothetical protein